MSINKYNHTILYGFYSPRESFCSSIVSGKDYREETNNDIVEYSSINNNVSSSTSNNDTNNKTNKSFKRIKDRYSNLNGKDKDEDYRKMTKHIANKKETSFIESINSRIRHYLVRLHRRTKCYSKSIDMLINSLYLLFDKLY